MAPFDAVMHSFTVVSTGGFSSHDASIAFFNSATIEMILALFMFLGGNNFALHFLAFHHRDWRYYWRDGEFRAYLAILLAATVFIAVYLFETRPTRTSSRRCATAHSRCCPWSPPPAMRARTSAPGRRSSVHCS